VPAASAPAGPPAAPPAAAPAAGTPPAETPPAAPPEEWGGEPYAFGDFTWLEGNSRQHKAVLDTPYFTPEFLVDVNYTNSTAQPIDNTVVGSTSLSRNNELTLSQMAVGGDFHFENAQGRLMLQYGMRSTLVPRNDGSSFHGQFDLQTALRYIAEAYGGYHWNVMHGVNIHFGIFMSYIGLYSYYPAENWQYVPSYTSDNTPWFFNGMRLQIFPTDTLKIEPWLINGWQSYAKFNEMPGFGVQVLWRPIEAISMNSNDYTGWDTQDNPGRFRFHTDNSFELMYYHVPMKDNFISKMAFTVTGDLGGETGDGVTPFGGHHDPTNTGASCTIKNPCTQHFLSWMAYNRIWFDHELFGWNIGGGQMSNPGRYLVLPPSGVATPYQALSTDGVSYTSPGTQFFSLNPGTTFNAWDVSTALQYMPNEQVTYDVEIQHRGSDTPYFAGHGGVTSPDGYQTTAVPGGWRADLVKTENRIVAAFLLRF
jgi:hypothetical protein